MSDGHMSRTGWRNPRESRHYTWQRRSLRELLRVVPVKQIREDLNTVHPGEFK